MNISDREELSKQIFKNTKLENEVNDLKEKLMAEKIRNKSELAMNDDLKRIIETNQIRLNILVLYFYRYYLVCLQLNV